MEFALAMHLHLPPGQADGMDFPRFRWHYHRWVAYHEEVRKQAEQAQKRASGKGR